MAIVFLDWLIRRNERIIIMNIYSYHMMILLFWIIVFHSFEGTPVKFIYFQF